MIENMEYIRKKYKMPVKRGMKVIAQGRNGIIIGVKNGYLEGEKNILSFYPTWEMEYLE